MRTDFKEILSSTLVFRLAPLVLDTADKGLAQTKQGSDRNYEIAVRPYLAGSILLVGEPRSPKRQSSLRLQLTCISRYKSEVAIAELLLAVPAVGDQLATAAGSDAVI